MMAACILVICIAAVAQEGPGRMRVLPPNPLPYDLLLKGGHVIDDKNNVDAMRDVGIKDGKIVAVAEHLNAKDALKTIDVTGLYVTPGLIDLHTHVFAGTGESGLLRRRLDRLSRRLHPPQRRHHHRRRRHLRLAQLR